MPTARELIVAHWLRNYLSPNNLLSIRSAYVKGQQIDLLSLSRSMFTTDYEIKGGIHQWRIDLMKTKHPLFINGELTNKFSFVLPYTNTKTVDVVIKKIPEIYGIVLYTLHSSGKISFYTERKPRLIHERKIGKEGLIQMLHSASSFQYGLSSVAYREYCRYLKQLAKSKSKI